MDRIIKALIVEDYEDDAELMILELNKSGYKIEYEIVDNETTLREALKNKKWNAIISDYKLPGFNALSALKIMQEMHLDLPFIVVSGTIGEEIAVQAMKAGAHDYIMKNNLTRLVPALEREIREADMRSERKESARRLRKQELLLRSVVDFLPVGLVLIDRNKNIVIANKEFRNIWGEIDSFKSAPAGVNISDFDTGKRLDFENWAIIRTIDEAKEIINEFIQIRLSNGISKIILNSVVPIIEETGMATYAIMVNQDITQLKQDEAHMKKTLLELERSNKELEQFAYVASHDLQEPLRMIASFTQLLSRKYKGKLEPDADDYINFAVNGAKRMQQLINDLLNYSRTTSYNRAQEYINLSNFLSSLLEEMKSLIEESCSEITVDPLPTIYANQMQVKQLFQNLITNAIKFRRAETPTVIKIRCEEEKHEWRFSIQDNGIGISPAYHEKIFTIFQRLHGRDEYPGTGIGLALCKKIVEQLGGKIWIESERDEGASFYFTLPKQYPDIQNLNIPGS